MSYGWANSFFEIVCENAAQAEEINDILNAPKNTSFSLPGFMETMMRFLDLIL